MAPDARRCRTRAKDRDGRKRARELAALRAALRAGKAAHIVVAGDFNTDLLAGSEERIFRGLPGSQDQVCRARSWKTGAWPA